MKKKVCRVIYIKSVCCHLCGHARGACRLLNRCKRGARSSPVRKEEEKKILSPVTTENESLLCCVYTMG